jgi:hypothetical protein
LRTKPIAHGYFAQQSQLSSQEKITQMVGLSEIALKGETVEIDAPDDRQNNR